MFSITVHFVDGNQITFDDGNAHENMESVMMTMKQAIRQGMFLQSDNKLIDFGQVTYVEVNEKPNDKEVIECLPEILEP